MREYDEYLLFTKDEIENEDYFELLEMSETYFVKDLDFNPWVRNFWHSRFPSFFQNFIDIRDKYRRNIIFLEMWISFIFTFEGSSILSYNYISNMILMRRF